MKAKDLREKSEADLLELDRVAREDLFRARMKNFTNRLDNTAAIRAGRRQVARIATLLSELRRRNP